MRTIRVSAVRGTRRERRPGQSRALRKRLSKEQIYANTKREVAALEQAGIDPDLYALQRQPDGSVARTPLSTTFKPTESDESSQHRDLKRWRAG